MKTKPTLIFIGGHHTGALLVAQRLLESQVEIVWIGHKRSMWGDKSVTAEYRDVISAGITFTSLTAGKFYQTLNPLKLIRIPYGFINAFFILLFLKLRLGHNLKGVVSFGGYLAVPVVFCAWLLRIPGITHEQTFVAGWANRFIGRFVKKIAVTWPTSQKYYPENKTVVTGLPVKPEYYSIKHHPTHPKTLFVTGGKQGSHLINQAIFTALPELLSTYRIVHQTGNNSQTGDFQIAQQIRENLPDNQKDKYVVYDYISGTEIVDIFSHASVVVGRSGAHLVYDLAVLGIPAVLVPIPWSSHNEQHANAQMLVSANQAVILPQDRLTTPNLMQSLNTALNLTPDKISIEKDAMEKFINLIKSQLL